MAATYDASSIQVLHGLEAVRKRPGMFVGDPRSPDAVAIAVGELVAHGAMAGSRHIVVTIESNLTFSVLAEGVGIPRVATTDPTALQSAFEQLHTPYCTTPECALLGGCHPQFINALSESFVVETVHDGILRRASWQLGNAVSPETDVGTASHPRILTRVTLDGAIYGASHPAAWEYLVAFLADSAVVVPGLRIHLWDKRRTSDATREFHAPEGLADRVRELGAIIDPTHPIYSAMWPDDEDNHAQWELALTWVAASDCEIQTLCPCKMKGVDGRLIDALVGILQSQDELATRRPTNVTRGLRAVVAGNAPWFILREGSMVEPLLDLPAWLAANPGVGPTKNR